jgi:hypothetical protein
MLYFGRHYVSTIKGERTKFVRCESCDKQYSYNETLHAGGKAHSSYFLDNKGAANRASSAAADNFRSGAVYVDVAIVPCPFCGWYQQPMAEVVRKRFGQNITLVIFLPMIFLLISIVATIGDGLLWVASSLSLLSITIITCRVLVGLSYNANWKHPNVKNTMIKLRSSGVVTQTKPWREILFNCSKTGIQAIGVLLLIGVVIFVLVSIKRPR